jgi:hypothetical protein
VTIKNAVFWDVTAYGCCNRRFGGTYRPHFQGERLWVPLVRSEDVRTNGRGGESLATRPPQPCLCVTMEIQLTSRGSVQSDD